MLKVANRDFRGKRVLWACRRSGGCGSVGVEEGEQECMERLEEEEVLHVGDIGSGLGR